MDNKQKTKHEKMFQGADFRFPFEKCEKMAELIKRYCAGEAGMVDCCAMMRKMMGCGTGEQTTRKKEQTEEKKL